MAATDDAFGYILGRARLREKAMFKAMNDANVGDFTNIDAKLLRKYEDEFTSTVFDAEGNLVDEAAKFAKKRSNINSRLKWFC